MALASACPCTETHDAPQHQTDIISAAKCFVFISKNNHASSEQADSEQVVDAEEVVLLVVLRKRCLCFTLLGAEVLVAFTKEYDWIYFLRLMVTYLSPGTAVAALREVSRANRAPTMMVMLIVFFLVHGVVVHELRFFHKTRRKRGGGAGIIRCKGKHEYCLLRICIV